MASSSKKVAVIVAGHEGGNGLPGFQGDFDQRVEVRRSVLLYQGRFVASIATCPKSRCAVTKGAAEVIFLLHVGQRPLYCDNRGG